MVLSWCFQIFGALPRLLYQVGGFQVRVLDRPARMSATCYNLSKGSHSCFQKETRGTRSLRRLVVMPPEELKRMLDRLPFEPFTIRMTDGKGYLVKHRDFVA